MSTPREAMTEVRRIIADRATSATPGALARLVVAGSVRASLDWAAASWSLEEGPTIVVADGTSTELLRGDGKALSSMARLTVNVHERSVDEDPAVLRELEGLLDGHRSEYGYRLRWVGTVRFPEDDAKVIRNAVELRYPAKR